MGTLTTVLLVTLLAWILAYHGASARTWTACIALCLVGLSASGTVAVPTLAILGITFAILALLFNGTVVRRRVLSAPLLSFFRKVMPPVSQTEQEALDAGTVWWDGDLFSGKPDWNRLLDFPAPKLKPEEQRFLDGPVEELCEMLDDWQITHELHDLPPHVWQFIKDQGFPGMIIPKQYGGLEFSALAHSEVVVKLASRCASAAVSVMVPNSLGPAELLLHYGSDEQKNHYLPRLARGLEIPCFALTSPEAGSDAESMPDFGVVCRGRWGDLSDVLGMRVTWEKRYITLGPIATLLGLAFRLYDPDHLLGEREDIGITLALIPTATPGVHIGRRHLPMGSSFMNGPNWGKDVFIPMDFVIGGADYVGQGWKMLMNCLAVGRSISLPASAAGFSKLAVLTCGAYGRVRSQFNTSIGRFGGVEEALARIAGNVYTIEAMRVMTAGAVDLGEKPSVVSAIVKYHATERGRAVVNDAMDIHGGKGISLGPSNYLGQVYQTVPIAITVEGANILTRSLIIFGQGIVRGHPYLLKEIEAAQQTDRARALGDFDAAIFGHAGFVLTNFARSLWLGFTRGHFAHVPGKAGPRRYYQQLTRLSSAFAFICDAVLFSVGGGLKRRERISARMGDILSLLYIASAVLKGHHDRGKPSDEQALLDWTLQDTFNKIEHAFHAVLANLPQRWLGFLLRHLIFSHGSEFKPPFDSLGHDVVALLLTPNAVRERLTQGIFISKNASDPIAALEAALRAVIAAEPIEAKLRAAIKRHEIQGRFGEQVIAQALEKNVLSKAEAETLESARVLRRRAIMVDDFPRDLGRSEITQSTQAVSFEALKRGSSDVARERNSA